MVVILLGSLRLVPGTEVVFELDVLVVVEDCDSIGVDEVDAKPGSCSCALVFCALAGRCAFCMFSGT